MKNLKLIREAGGFYLKYDTIICGTITHVTISINPFPRWKYQTKWFFQRMYLKLTNQEYKICEGCGEGVSKWRIRNPNYGKHRHKFNCCDACVFFYDVRWSHKKIIGWEKGKAKVENV